MTPPDPAAGSGRDGSTVMQTTYREHGAGALLEYIERDGAALRDPTGMKMTESEKENFIEKSERHEFQRDFIVSPDPDDGVTPGEVARGTMKAMRTFAKGRPTVSWCFAVHEDTDTPHVHVAATGERDDLYMDRDDLVRERERFHERIREAPTYQRRQRNERQQQREQEQQAGQEQQAEQTHGERRDGPGWSR